jgi:hypothetical protein
MNGLFPTIFHGERSELCEKYRLATCNPSGSVDEPSGLIPQPAHLATAPQIALASKAYYSSRQLLR